MDYLENDLYGLDNLEIENTSIDEIGGDAVTLMFLGIDQSGSMISFANEMRQQLSSFKTSLLNSNEADEIIIARADFWCNTINISGYKKAADLDVRYLADGGTPLYDTILEGTDKLLNYMNFLKTNGMRTKAVFSIFSDGCDTTSKVSFYEAKTCLEKLNNLEIITAYVAFGKEGTPEAKRLGFRNILELGKSQEDLRRAFGCLSRSMSATSQKVVIDDPNNFFEV